MPTVYLLHFDKPNPNFKRCIRHYLGWTVDLDARIARHRAGTGSALCRTMSAAGIDFSVVRTWAAETREQAWAFERGLKMQKNASRLCPVCSPPKISELAPKTLAFGAAGP